MPLDHQRGLSNTEGFFLIWNGPVPILELWPTIIMESALFFPTGTCRGWEGVVNFASYSSQTFENPRFKKIGSCKRLGHSTP